MFYAKIVKEDWGKMTSEEKAKLKMENLPVADSIKNSNAKNKKSWRIKSKWD